MGETNESPRMKNYAYSTLFRRILWLLLPIPAGGIIWYLIRLYNPYSATSRPIFLACIFHRITGMHCPGCGLSRAVFDITSLNIADALRNNALFVIFIFPLLAYLFISEYLSFVFKKPILPRVRINIKWVIFFIILAIIFTVVRNLPFPPWNYLAPL